MPQGQGPEEKKALDGEGEGGYFRNFRGSRTGASGSQGCEVGVRRSRIEGDAVPRPGWAETGMEILELVLRLPRRMTAPTPHHPGTGVSSSPAPRPQGRSARPAPPARSGPRQGPRAAAGPAAATHPEG